MASDVAALVSEMNDTLVEIRTTIDALSTATHTSRLDQLEHQRDSTIAALRANFERETDDLAAKRRRERDEIAERRRQEDEEISARRRQEDADMDDRHGREDEDRERRFVSETDDVEDEMDGLMESVETEAESFLAQGRDKLAQLEERRKELNRLIDEQVRVPLPTVTTRRRSRNSRTMDAAITSKPAPAQATGEPVNNSLKAIKEEHDSGAMEELPQQAGRGPLASHGEEDERAVSGSENASRGSFESIGPRRSRTASVSSSQRGSRMSAFGWIAGKIGLSETREETKAGQEHEDTTESEAIPEVPKRSPDMPGGIDVSEASANGQELTPSTLAREIEENDTTLPIEEPSSADLPMLGSIVYNGEPQATTTSQTRTSSDATSSPVKENEGHDIAPTHNEIQDLPPKDQERFQDSQLSPGNRSPSYYPTDDTQDGLEFDRNQYLQPAAAYSEASGSEVAHDPSTATSSPESPVGAAPGLDGSETTLEVDAEHYLEQEYIQKAKDEESEGGFDSEQEAADVHDGETDAVIHGIGVGSLDDEAQKPAVPMETLDIKEEERDISFSGLDQERSPSPHTHDNGTAMVDTDPKDAQYELDGDVDVEPRSVSAQQDIEELKDAQSGPPLPAVVDEEHPTPAPESPVSEVPKQSHVFDDASEMAPVERGDEHNAIASGTYDEGMHQTEESPALQYSAAEETLDVTSEPATEVAPQDPELEQATERPLSLDENSPIELPPHAKDYSLGVVTVQLPNGTWPAKEVDEAFLESLIAQFLVSSRTKSGHSSSEEISTVPLSAEKNNLSSPPLEDQLEETLAPKADERNCDDELVDDTWSSFAHEVQPVAVQLASGLWSLDPTSSEFDDAVAYQSAAASEVHLSQLNAPGYEVEYSSDEPSAHGAAADVEPAAMQLPTGAWVTHPSEELYEIVPEQSEQTSTPVNDYVPTLDTMASPTDDIHGDISSEDIGSPSHMGLDHTSLAANPEDPAQKANKEQVLSAQVSGASNDETVGVEEAIIPSEQEVSEDQDEHPSYGATQAASMDGTNLPWSPFNSRIPLSPEASPSAVVHSPDLDETYEAERDAREDAVNTAGRHSTFGYGSNQAGPGAADYQMHDIAGNPYADADMLNPTEAATDTESQNFVTPLQSAGMQSPQSSQDPPDTFHNAVDYSHDVAPHEEAAMTVHGQDELFDSDSMSEYEPDPSVDENGDPRANLGMPPQHHVLANGRADETTDSPNTAILQPEAENPYQRTPEMPSAVEDNSDVSPMSLRESSPPPIPPRRGLAFSRHNPERPVTPLAQTIPEDLGSHQGTWDMTGPIDSTPMSLVSHSTLSSSPGSPVQERVHEGREPAIQNSWSEGIHDDQHGHHEYEREYETTPAQDVKLDENIPTPIATHMPESVRDYSPATPSPSTLIQKMRSIFENPTDSSPVRSRPSSGIYNPPRPLESPGYDVPGERRKGGFLNEAEDDVDERSALLGSVERN